MAEGRLGIVVSHVIALKSKNTSRKLYLQWRNADLFSSVFSFFGLITATVDYEFAFSPERTHSNCAENPNQIYRYLTAIFTCISIFFLSLRHYSKSIWHNKLLTTFRQGNLSLIFGELKRFISLRLVTELVVLSIFPYPHIRGKLLYPQPNTEEKNEDYSYNIRVCYNISEFLYVFMFARLFFILRSVFNFTLYQDAHARFYCAKYGQKANVRFAIRCMMKSHPFVLIYSTSFASFILFGIFMRVFERPYSDLSGMNFDSLENSIWTCAITMSTVGYGELYPSTVFGRIVGVVCAMWGSFMFSMLVFTFKKLLDLDPNQKLAFLSIKQTRTAGRVVVNSLKYQMYKKKFGKSSIKSNNQFARLMGRLKKFTATLKNLKMTDVHLQELVQKSSFESLPKNLKYLERHIEELIKKVVKNV